MKHHKKRHVDAVKTWTNPRNLRPEKYGHSRLIGGNNTWAQDAGSTQPTSWARGKLR